MKLIKTLIFISIALSAYPQECQLFDSRTILSDTTQSISLENLINVKAGGIVAYQTYEVGDNYRCEVQRLDFEFNTIWEYEKTSADKLELHQVVENDDESLLLIFKTNDAILVQRLSSQGDLESEEDITSSFGTSSINHVAIHNMIKEKNYWILLANSSNDLIVKINERGQVIESVPLGPYFETEPDPYDPWWREPISSSHKIIDYDINFFLLIGSTNIKPYQNGGDGVIAHLMKVNKSTFEFESIEFENVWDIFTIHTSITIRDAIVHQNKNISLLIYTRPSGIDSGSPNSYYAKLDAEQNFIVNQFLHTSTATSMYENMQKEILIYMDNALYKVDNRGYLFWGSDYLGFTDRQRQSNYNYVTDADDNIYFNLYSYIDSTFYNRKVKVASNNGCVNFISGYVHHDENQDCLRQDSEYRIERIRIKDDFDYRNAFYFAGNPNRYITTDTNGYYQFPLVRDTGNITIRHGLLDNPILENTCIDSVFYDVRDSINYHLEEVNFSIWAESLCSDLELRSAHATKRICASGRTTLIFQNNGILTEYDQQIRIKTDGKIIIDTSTQDIHSIIDGVYSFNPIERDLTVGRSLRFVINDSISCDAQLNDVAFIYTELELDRPCDELNPILFDTISIVLVNSFDPNDITGLIDGDQECYDPNTTSQNIHYTVRFQNTGNDTAFKVTVIDTFSSRFDMETLTFLNESHAYESNISEDSILIIEFEDINLLDTSWHLSPEMTEGFIQFTIEANFASYTTVDNRVGIYFDRNDPIITNTSSLSFCDRDSDGYSIDIDCDDMNPLVYPGQTELPYNSLDDDCDTATLDNDLDQDGFLLAEDCDDTNPNINPSISEIPNNSVDENCDGLDMTTAVHSLSNATISIYPNPTSDLIYICLLYTSPSPRDRG